MKCNPALRDLFDLIRRDWDGLLFSSFLIAFGAASLVLPRPSSSPEFLYLLRDTTFIVAGAVLMIGGVSKLYYLRVTGMILYATALLAYVVVVVSGINSSGSIFLLAVVLSTIGETRRMGYRNQREKARSLVEHRLARST
jgi:hypothetical protein